MIIDFVVKEQKKRQKNKNVFIFVLKFHVYFGATVQGYKPRPIRAAEQVH